MKAVAAAGKTRILVLGGGFAGINAVMALERQFAQDDSVEILLVSRENFFLFTPMLSEVAIGTVDPRHIVTPIRELCHKTHFNRAEVTDIDLEHQTVTVLYNNVARCPDVLSYDHLVLALGSSTNTSLVPGVAQYAFQFKEIVDALILRNHILEMFERADTESDPVRRRAMLTFCVIGGGYSGVEIAAAMQEMALRIVRLYPTIDADDIQVVLFEAGDRLLSTLPLELSGYAHDQLEEAGIDVQLSTRVTEVAAGWMSLDTGIRVPSFTVVWATGIVIPPLMMGLPVSKDPKGRPLATSELRLAGYNNVWAIGDNVLAPYANKAGFYPATAQIALQQGRHVAENLRRVVRGLAPKPFTYEQKGEMVVLGFRSAVALVYGIKLKGFLAWLLWRMFYLMRLPRRKKRIWVAMDWLMSLFGPMETTQLKLYKREEPNDMAETASQIDLQWMSDTSPQGMSRSRPV